VTDGDYESFPFTGLVVQVVTQGRRIAPDLSFSPADYSRSTVQVAEIQSSRLGPARESSEVVVFVGVVDIDLTCKRKRQRDLASDKPSEWERARYFCYIFSCIQSLDFTVNRFFMKLFKTSNIEIVHYCQTVFSCELPSVLLGKRNDKFIAKLSCTSV